MRIFPLGVGEKYANASFDTSSNKNPGQGKVTEKSSSGKHPTIRVAPLDELAIKLGWYKQEVAILKIDVEGFEIQVVRGAKAFLASKLVKNIFLEGNVGTKNQESDFSGNGQDFGGFRIFRL